MCTLLPTTLACLIPKTFCFVGMLRESWWSIMLPALSLASHSITGIICWISPVTTPVLFKTIPIKILRGQNKTKCSRPSRISFVNPYCLYCGQLWVRRMFCGRTCDELYHFTFCTDHFGIPLGSQPIRLL